MHIDDLAALMDRYRKGQCTPEEKKIIEEWYEALQLGPSSEEGEAPELEAFEVDASLDRVFKGLRERRPGAEEDDTAGQEPRFGEAAVPMHDTGARGRTADMHGDAPPRIRAARRLGTVAAIAAALVLALGAYWALRLASPDGHRIGASPDEIVVSTVSGEIKKMLLPDGTTLQLNANSSIRYARVFNGAKRRVILEKGEAFFQVATDPAHPFVVEAGGLETLVLGTCFDVRSYARDSGTVVAVVSGKVQVSTPYNNQSLTLTPHELVRYGKGSMSKSRFDKEMEVDAWKERAMNFVDASFEDIAFQIENLYNVPVVNQSSKKHWSYTGYFDNESVWEIIKTICITENLDYRFSEGHIILTNKN